jgi:hypothetical protein
VSAARISRTGDMVRESPVRRGGRMVFVGQPHVPCPYNGDIRRLGRSTYMARRHAMGPSDAASAQSRNAGSASVRAWRP